MAGSADTPRIALITGGEGDLATAITQALEESGCSVLRPGRSQLDVCREDSVQSYIKELPRLDLLINNAGLRRDALLLKMTDGQWQEVMEANLKGAFLCSKAATRLMVRQRQGHIINIGSFSALGGPAGQANYAAAKAGLIGLTQSLARELGGRNVRVNCVLPGWLETKFVRSTPPAVTEKARQDHTLGRFNTAEEAAKAIAFLDTLSHVSGQVFQLDSRISRHL